MGLEWMVVAMVVAELQQEVVVLQLEVVGVLVWVEVVERLCESWIPPLFQSCVEVPE